jgi:Holliday junction resolvase RusA-like endonuclease
MIWKRRPMPREPFVSRPDASNVLKAVEDALEKAGVYRDDKQVWVATIESVYCSGEETPLVRASLEW